MYLLGYDIGSSSVKANLVNIVTGKSAASAFYPKNEMEIKAKQPGWAEQDPENWWKNLKDATMEVLQKTRAKKQDIKAIGISYQMHGLVCVGKNQQVLRDSIIWCDSRAVDIGKKAFKAIGKEQCLSAMLNSPGNFTASKLAWVKENEPAIFDQIAKIMLPGDYIAMRLSGTINTTISGLSEGILWDFQNNELSKPVLNQYGLDEKLIADIAPTFAVQCELSEKAASELGLEKGTPISYRAGDQPNNALSLNVLNPGEIAATAGTSGVVYGISDEVKYDPESRVNTFAHVNYTPDKNRLGVLLCINGTGILNSWLKHNVGLDTMDYHGMNQRAAKVPVGSDGLTILPFGNGAERMLSNQNPGCSINNLNFNIHTNAHLFRAAQEGIVFSFNYGIEVMKETGISPSVIRAGNANMFLSPIFRDTLAGITGASIELYDTDGSQGAAIGAGIGAGIYASFEEAFSGLERISVIEPDKNNTGRYQEAYQNWLSILNIII